MKRESGSVLALSAILTLAIGILIIAMSKVTNYNVHQALYLDGLNQSYKTAESGMNEATGRLVNDPKGYANFNNITSTIALGDGLCYYSSVVQQMNTILPGGYYIVTSATYVVKDRLYASRLHTHLKVSNVADYFAAVANPLTLSADIDISQGRVYSPDLSFATTGVTKVKAAEFVTSCSPGLDWSVATKNAVQITEPAPADVSDPLKANEPVQLQATIVFPQISDSDLVRYKSLAGPHVGTFNFAGDIFPPGYQTAGCGPLPGDTYANHTCDSSQHVYYSVDDIKIKGVVHGQVLFVSEKNIIIEGSLTSALPGDPLPGAGFASSSTAHQAILITPKNAVIDSTFYVGPGNETQTIQALVMAPAGTINVSSYTAANVPQHLSLLFNGSMILGTQPNDMINVFKGPGGRTYGYMDSLTTNPPPYLPAIVDIYYSLEETTSSSSMF